MFFKVLTILSSVIILAIGSAANADGLADATAGQAALQSGNNDAAISLFNRAIASGALQGEFLELAYNCRGRAYLGKQNYWAAISDLDQARRLDPGDSDAQSNLVVAISAVQPADMVPDQSASRVLGKLGKSLLKGALSGIAQGLSQQSQ